MGPLLDALDASGKRIILGLDPPVFKDREGRRLFDWYVREHGELDDPEALERLTWEMIDGQETRAVDAALEAEARARGLDLMRLETGEDSPEAIRAYERVGYARRGPFGDYEENGSSVFMERRLA